jgi:hypothetical protein
MNYDRSIVIILQPVSQNALHRDSRIYVRWPLGQRIKEGFQTRLERKTLAGCPYLYFLLRTHSENVAA